MPTRPRSRPAVLLGLLLLLACAACTASRTQPAPSALYADPWADRPVVSLNFDVAPDLHSASGRENVAFTPDLATCELVFRAWPNKPTTSRAGSSLVVSQVSVDGQTVVAQDVPAGAPGNAPGGTLLQIPLAECAQPGQHVTIALSFTVKLGEDVDERVGTSSVDQIAWLGTAFPLLAWERGQGWQRDPAVFMNGEMAVSEDFQLASLDVTAPSKYQVMGTGSAAGTRPGVKAGTTVHQFTASAVRDVTVTVGQLDVVDRTVDGVKVHVAAAQGRGTDLAAWTDDLAVNEKALVDLLGPFPYQDLWVTVVPSQSSGIEYPGAVQFGAVNPDARRALVAHELAHMWFYSLVGNDQGRDPWLDESFATYAQMVTAGGDTPAYADIPDADRRNVGKPMTYWAQVRHSNTKYYETVYNVGAAALIQARKAAGADAFDSALREYLRRNAHSIATPQDVMAAFANLPDALAVLRGVGAIPSAGG